MVNDKIYGAIMSFIGLVGIAVEGWFLIFKPLLEPSSLGTLSSGIYWAVAIPLFFAVLGVLGIVVWIGFTMIRTPPPEAWNFEELEDDSEEKIEEAS